MSYQSYNLWPTASNPSPVIVVNLPAGKKYLGTSTYQLQNGIWTWVPQKHKGHNQDIRTPSSFLPENPLGVFAKFGLSEPGLKDNAYHKLQYCTTLRTWVFFIRSGAVVYVYEEVWPRMHVSGQSCLSSISSLFTRAAELPNLHFRSPPAPGWLGGHSCWMCGHI